MALRIALSELQNALESVGSEEDERLQATPSSEYAHGVHAHGQAVPTLPSIGYEDERPKQK